MKNDELRMKSIEDLFHLPVEVFEVAVVMENIVGHLHAATDILVVWVGGGHLPRLILKERLVGDMVSLRTAYDHALIADSRVGIHSEQEEMFLLAQGFHLAGGTHALNDGIRPVFDSLQVELVGDVGGRMGGTQVVSHHYKRITVKLHTSPLRLFNEVAADGVVLVAVMLAQIIDHGALARTQSSSDSDNVHNYTILATS